jgi:hypothetical protein
LLALDRPPRVLGARGRPAGTPYRPPKLLVQRRKPDLRQFFLALLTLPLRAHDFRTERLQQVSGLSPLRHFRPTVWKATQTLFWQKPFGQFCGVQVGAGGGTATQVLLLQVAPVLQAPLQHGWPTAPHGLHRLF